MLIILFGLAGSGKNFVGEIFAKEFGYYFWDGDKNLPEEILESIRNNKPFTQTMRDKITITIIQKISELLKSHDQLVVAQALYKEVNREMIHKKFPEGLFVHVTANTDIIFQRLKQRKNLVDENYAKKIINEFEPPKLQHRVVINNNDKKTILEQIKSLK